MSHDNAARRAPGAAGLKAIAAEFHGMALDDAHAEAIASELAWLEAGAAAAGPAPLDASPGALFRQQLLAGASGARRS